ncbi:unnamed protein product [Oppiella nova]|uniref:Uncharacterized protein n=1 Tax=Oppiella nova TaxID=334625 RepID=A0A7R9LPX6_9ACAR|nr:unnamed protein product [Oppiella nova]CAG2165798.1 unnamed protein product [Oppiella nova]
MDLFDGQECEKVKNGLDLLVDSLLELYEIIERQFQ